MLPRLVATLATIATETEKSQTKMGPMSLLLLQCLLSSTNGPTMRLQDARIEPSARVESGAIQVGHHRRGQVLRALASACTAPELHGRGLALLTWWAHLCCRELVALASACIAPKWYDLGATLLT